VDSWGRDMAPKQRFADLLTAVGEVPGIERVRFLTSHPKYMSERVVAAVAATPTLMPCFNIPFQSGDDDVLRHMRRGYSRERFLDIVRAIRAQLPDAAITADCIVGFPGETEEQFQATLSLMEEVQFEQVNTAAYSPRPNTPAADWAGQLPEDVKQDRLQRINRLASTHALARTQRFVGRVQEVRHLSCHVHVSIPGLFLIRFWMPLFSHLLVLFFVALWSGAGGRSQPQAAQATGGEEPALAVSVLRRQLRRAQGDALFIHRRGYLCLCRVVCAQVLTTPFSVPSVCDECVFRARLCRYASSRRGHTPSRGSSRAPRGDEKRRDSSGHEKVSSGRPDLEVPFRT
jgi:Radical SAM superfamily